MLRGADEGDRDVSTTLCYPTCQKCGTRFEAYRLSAKWCPKCKPGVVREQRRRAYVNSWVTNTCQDCGAQFVSTVPAAWCLKCRPWHRNLAVIEGCKAYHEKQKANPTILDDPWIHLFARLVLSCPHDEDCTTCVVAEWCGEYSGYTEPICYAESPPVSYHLPFHSQVLGTCR